MKQSDYNTSKIYEKDGKLWKIIIQSINYINEFDKFFTQVNRIKNQKRKTRQSLKNGSLEYEIPLYKTLNLSEPNNKINEDTLLNGERKYNVFNIAFVIFLCQLITKKSMLHTLKRGLIKIQ